MNRNSFITALFTTFLSSLLSTPVFAQDAAPPAQFYIPFRWQHDCNADGFGMVRQPDDVPAYQARDDTGRWHISAGFSTDSGDKCPEDEQILYTETGRLPAGVEALRAKGWPVDDPTVVYISRRAIAGEAVVTVTWVPSAPAAPPAPEAPDPGIWLGRFETAPTAERIGDTYSTLEGAVYVWTRSGGWKMQTPAPQRGEAGINGVNGVNGTTGAAAWASESLYAVGGVDFLCPDREVEEDMWSMAIMAEISFDFHFSNRMLGGIYGRFGGPGEWVGYAYQNGYRPSFAVGGEIRFVPAKWMYVGLGGSYNAYGIYQALDPDGEWDYYAGNDNGGPRVSLGLIPLPGKNSSPILVILAQGGLGLGSNPNMIAAQLGWRWDLKGDKGEDDD